jgi:hypothetical protein
MPVAANCWVVPAGISGFVGAMLIETSGSCTVRVAELTIDPAEASILAVPAAKPVASPSDPDTLPTVATVGEEEDQTTVVVMFAEVPSEYRPTAVSCCVPPMGTNEPCGVISMAARMALLTVKLPDPLTAPEVALMTEFPLPVPVARPLVPGVLLTVATVGDDELQTTELLTFCVDPSVNVPIAVKACF